MFNLVLQSGKQQGKRVALPDGEAVVGRDPICHIRIQSTKVSRNHCAIRNTADGLFVRDLGSRNKTFVNDVPIEDERRLKPGDLLTVGSMTFKVVDDTVSDDKVTATKPATPGQPVPGSATDDNIADWLTEEKSGLFQPPPKDSAKGQSGAAKEAAQPVAQAKQKAADSAEKDPLVDKAGAIIRRHWEGRSQKP